METVTTSDLPPPTVIEPDWNAIRERYLQGEELEAIAADCGTTANAISCQAYRNKWKDAQARLLLRDEAVVSKEIRANLILSVLKESRWFQRLDPVRDAQEADTWSKVRERCANTAAKLLGWEAQRDPAGLRNARCLDV